MLGEWTIGHIELQSLWRGGEPSLFFQIQKHHLLFESGISLLVIGLEPSDHMIVTSSCKWHFLMNIELLLCASRVCLCFGKGYINCYKTIKTLHPKLVLLRLYVATCSIFRPWVQRRQMQFLFTLPSCVGNRLLLKSMHGALHLGLSLAHKDYDSTCLQLWYRPLSFFSPSCVNTELWIYSEATMI